VWPIFLFNTEKRGHLKKKHRKKRLKEDREPLEISKEEGVQANIADGTINPMSSKP